jgi:hypothetical protein
MFTDPGLEDASFEGCARIEEEDDPAGGVVGQAMGWYGHGGRGGAYTIRPSGR